MHWYKCCGKACRFYLKSNSMCTALKMEATDTFETLLTVYNYTRHLISKLWTFPKHSCESLAYRVVCVPMLHGLLYEFRSFIRLINSTHRRRFLQVMLWKCCQKYCFQECCETNESESYTMEHIRVSAIEDLYLST